MRISLNLMKKYYEAKTKKEPENPYSQEKIDYLVKKKELIDINKSLFELAVENKKPKTA